MNEFVEKLPLWSALTVLKYRTFTPKLWLEAVAQTSQSNYKGKKTYQQPINLAHVYSKIIHSLYKSLCLSFWVNALCWAYPLRSLGFVITNIPLSVHEFVPFFRWYDITDKLSVYLFVVDLFECVSSDELSYLSKWTAKQKRDFSVE